MQEVSSEEKLVHDIECANCKKMFECKGKPKEVKACVGFEERTRKE